MKLIEQIVEALSATKKAMHVDDIAKAIITKYPNTQDTPEILSAKASSILSSDISRRKSDSLFSKPKNKAGASVVAFTA